MSSIFDRPFDANDYRCLRCGFTCPHVEANGMWYCPNCGLAKPVDEKRVTYDFGCGCKECNLAGHQPLPGYMRPEPKTSPRVVFGLAPSEEGGAR